MGRATPVPRRTTRRHRLRHGHGHRHRHDTDPEGDADTVPADGCDDLVLGAEGEDAGRVTDAGPCTCTWAGDFRNAAIGMPSCYRRGMRLSVLGLLTLAADVDGVTGAGAVYVYLGGGL